MPEIESQSERSNSDISTKDGWKEALRKLEAVGTTLAICYYLWKFVEALLSAGIL